MAGRVVVAREERMVDMNCLLACIGAEVLGDSPRYDQIRGLR